jgi:hypothetical protein
MECPLSVQAVLAGMPIGHFVLQLNKVEDWGISLSFLRIITTDPLPNKNNVSPCAPAGQASENARECNQRRK